MSTATTLLPLVERYVEEDPGKAASHLEALPEEQAIEALRVLSPESAARVLPHLQMTYAAALLRDAESVAFKRIAGSMDAARAATIFMHLPPESRQRLFPHLPKKLQKEVEEHLTYPEGSVGRIMLSDFLAFRENFKVRDAVKKIRSIAQKRFPASYVYVVDEHERLVGVVNMRDLLLADERENLSSVKRGDVFSLHSFTDVKDAAEELARRRYFAAPVVDSDGRMLGIIKAEHLFLGVQQGVARDIQKMFGAGANERAFSPIRYSLRKRLPWLHVNLATAFLAAAVVALFQETIERITILAVFLPVVAGQGGNAGAQSLAIVMRGLVMREIPPGKTVTLVLKEGWLGVINGTVTGAVTALVAWVWYGNPYLGLVVGLGMIVNLFFAGMSGAAIPVTMRRLGLDPAQCSSIVLTTVTDVVGFFAFLGFAAIFADRLV